MTRTHLTTALGLALATAAFSAESTDWAKFRGPAGNGAQPDDAVFIDMNASHHRQLLVHARDAAAVDKPENPLCPRVNALYEPGVGRGLS